MQVWRLIAEKHVTLHELETTWCLDDVARLNSYLELKSDIMEAESEKAKNDRS